MAIDSSGLEKVFNNLNKEINKIEGRTLEGLLYATFLIKRESLKRTPIKTGNLRGSCFVVWTTESGKSNKLKEEEANESGIFTNDDEGRRLAENHRIVVEKAKGLLRKDVISTIIGYTASYALSVHEIDRDYRAPNTSWKFLESTITAFKGQILKIIKSKVKKK